MKSSRKFLRFSVFILVFYFCQFARSAVCSTPDPKVALAFDMMKTSNSKVFLKDYLVENSIDRDARNVNCETLYFAAIRGRLHQYLYDLEKAGYAADTESIDSELNLTPYQYAQMYGDIPTILAFEAILKSRITYDIQYWDPPRTFDLSLLHNRLDVIDWLVTTQNISMTLPSPTPCGTETLLLKAVKASRPVPILRYLIEKGADVDAGAWCHPLPNPIVTAVSRGDEETTKLLIRYGANAQYTLAAALQNGRKDLVFLLLDAGVLPTINHTFTTEFLKNDTLASALYFSADLATMQRIIQADPSVLKTKFDTYGVEFVPFEGVHFGGVNALMFAAAKSSQDVIEALILLGLDPATPAWVGIKAYDVALKMNRPQSILDLLKEK